MGEFADDEIDRLLQEQLKHRHPIQEDEDEDDDIEESWIDE